MKKFIASILATTMALEMGVVPVAMALESQDNIFESFSEDWSEPYETFPTTFSDDSELEQVSTISDFGIVSGTCGDNLTWELVEDTGVLTISGEGEMESASWYLYEEIITEVNIEYGVTNIVNGAFYECENLKVVTIPTTVIEIEDYAFYKCVNLPSILIPEGVTSIGRSVFHFCNNLTAIDLPSTLTNMEGSLFYYCTRLTSINVDSKNQSYISVNNVLFSKDMSELIAYPAGLTDNSYSIPSGVKRILEYAFEHSNISSISIPSGVTEICSGVFVGCDNLLSVEIPDGVETIGDSVFYSCDNLSSVSLPSSLKTIGMQAFRLCEKLESVVVPSGVKTIGSSTFYQCSKLTSITIPNSVTSIDKDAFIFCRNLTDVYFKGSPQEWNKISVGTSNDNLLNATIHFSESNIYTPFTATVTMSNGSSEFEKTSSTVSVDWDDNWFLSNSINEDGKSVYIHDLAITSAALSGAAYSGYWTELALKELGFSNIDQNYISPTANNYDTVSYTIGRKTLYDEKGEQVNVVAVIIKGTSADEEWYSNFNMGYGDTHSGFQKASELVWERIEKFYGNLDPETTRYYVTGHSRGGAVANLVASTLNNSEIVKKENVFAYTYAAPTVSTEAKMSGHENIINITNGEDFISQAPLAQWGFKHYGIDLMLPSISYTEYNFKFGEASLYSTYKSEMNKTFKTLTNEDFETYIMGVESVNNALDYMYYLAPNLKGYYTNQYKTSYFSSSMTATPSQYFTAIANIKIGLTSASSLGNFLRDYRELTAFFGFNSTEFLFLEPNIGRNHSVAAYYSWLEALSPEQLFTSTNSNSQANYKKLIVSCPVDIYVYDSNDILVASIVNDEVEKNILAVGTYEILDGDDEPTGEIQKILHLPQGDEFRIEIVGNDDGTMEYEIAELTATGIGSVTNREVNFDTIDIVKNQVITTTINDEINTDVKNYTLEKEDGTLIQAITDVISHNITLNFNDSAMEDVIYTTKTDGKLAYLPTGQNDCFEFKGWFTEKSGGTQVTIDTVFNQNMTIYAQWVEIDDGNDDNVDNTVEITTNSIDYAEGSASVNYSFKGDMAGHGVSVGTTKESVENRTGKTLFNDMPYNSNGSWGTGTIGFTILLNYFTDVTEPLYVMMYAMDTEGNYVNGNVLTLLRSDETVPEPTTCTITFNANSGTFPHLSTTIYENQPISSDFFDGTYPDPQRTGYTFKGWYTASTGGTKITASTVFSSNTTIYAQWTAIESDNVTYTVTFDGNDGKVNVKTMETGSDFKLSSLPTPTLEGYTFDGWFTTKTGSTEVTTDYKFTKDRTIYAQWTKVYSTYTIKFDSKGGIDKAVYLTTDEDGYVDKFPTPTHETLFFDGWYLTQNGGPEAVTEDTVFTENTFLYARWKDETSYFGTYKNMIIAQNTRGSNYGGTVSTDNNNPMEGETVILTVNPTYRYSLLSISAVNSRGTTVSLKKISDDKYSFVQPADDLEITAIFEFKTN